MPEQQPRRRRPVVNLTLAADVRDELRRRAERDGASLSRVSEAALRAGLGLPAEPPTVGAAAPTT